MALLTDSMAALHNSTIFFTLMVYVTLFVSSCVWSVIGKKNTGALIMLDMCVIYALLSWYRS